MIEFLHLCTISFTIVVLCSFCGAVVMNFCSMNPKLSQEKRDRYSDYIFSFLFCCQYALLFAAFFAVLWLGALTFEAFGYF